MEQTILKLYVNGNMETFVPTFTKSGVTGNYKFTPSEIVVPDLVEYPPSSYRNYFVEKTSVSGYINASNGSIYSPDQYDRTSDFISVAGWGSGVTRIWYEKLTSSYDVWVGLAFYNASKQFLSMRVDDVIAQAGSSQNLIYTHIFPAEVAYIRVATNYYDHATSVVKISVEQGAFASNVHFPALEDFPIWVQPTESPISIFPQGVVIKGTHTKN